MTIQYSNTYLLPLSSTITCPMASIFIDPDNDASFIGICLEGFLYGKISIHMLKFDTVPCQIPILGLYSGIFAMYLKFQSNKFRKATIVFYALCLLYVLSTATICSDLGIMMLQLLKETEVSNHSISKVIIFYNQLCG